MAQYECSECNKNLHGHPKIRVEGEIYCYACAKRLVEILDGPTEAKHAKEMKAHDIQYEKWKKWNEKRELALPSPKTQMWIGCASPS